MSKKTLEVGTYIFCRNYGTMSYFGEVDRVTEKFAFVGSSKFVREYGSMHLDIVPREKWSVTSYFIPDEKDIIELKKQQLIRFVTKFDYSKLSFDKMCEIRDIIKRPE